MDDVRAVMDAAGSERAAIVGCRKAAPMSVLFAATHPQRTGRSCSASASRRGCLLDSPKGRPERVAASTS